MISFTHFIEQKMYLEQDAPPGGPPAGGPPPGGPPGGGMPMPPGGAGGGQIGRAHV